MSRRYEGNCDPVSAYVDGSHQDLGQNKGISFLLDPQKPTVDLTATSNSELFEWIPMMTKIKITN